MKKLTMTIQDEDSIRIQYGADLLRDAFEDIGYVVSKDLNDWTLNNYRLTENWKIFIGNRNESTFIQELEDKEVLLYHTYAPRDEGFYLAVLPGNLIVISGGGDSGCLYGCQELARLLKEKGDIPSNLGFSDEPDMVLRGPALGLQKTTIEPPRQTYEYPVTPDRFPWFYDKEQWERFLDMLFEQRSNILYIWSGHPFSSFVQLKEYPEALEVTEEELQKNTELLTWLITEADKRGIWVVLKFYNIHIPLPFAEKHGLDLHQSKPLPITSDYYQKTIAEFMRSFPKVGLMVCLGEALQGQIYGAEWFTETILAGVNEGIKSLDLKELPPIILRAHSIEPEKVIEKAFPLYPNLYTMGKYNGESLTTWTPRGDWQQTHQNLSQLKTVHIINVHILANLEPFRYGSPTFIHKSMQAAKYRLQANGLHLYPLFYWDWPYAPDQSTTRLLQMDRDWIWFAAWARYAWNTDLNPETEQYYWAEKLGEMYGGTAAGQSILEAYDLSGECAPKLLRRIGITEGNRQTMSLGMTMSQLTNPNRHRPWKDLWDSHAPEGERLDDFVQNKLAGLPHVGETPIDMIEEVERDADAAVKAIDEARKHVTRNYDEFERLAQDMYAIQAMVYTYTYKVRTAIQVLTYKYTEKNSLFEHVHLLEKGIPYLQKSLEWYEKLAAITEKTYLYANSMQTRQRKVPLPDGGKYDHWTKVLPIYKKELEHFTKHVLDLKAGTLPASLDIEENTIEKYQEAKFTLHSQDAELYTIEERSAIFSDGDIHILSVAEELKGLTGIRFSQMEANEKEINLDIEFEEDTKLLIGYFNASGSQWLSVPDLEVDTHADQRGGVTPILRNGVEVYVYPSVNVHAFQYEKGRHHISFGKGAYIVLGAISADQPIQEREVNLNDDGNDTLDWLYE